MTDTTARHPPTPTPPTLPRGRAETVRWWLLLGICTGYALFAITAGVAELLSWAGALRGTEPRAVPLAFVPHAIAGGIALVTGCLQFGRRLRARRPRLHRGIGRGYVVAVWIASATGLWSAFFFDDGRPARIALAAGAVLWFLATTIAFQRIRRRRVASHREWMIRSFALSLFFVTFEFWTEGLQAAGLSRSVGYPLGVLLAWSVNLAVAETRIRLTRIPLRAPRSSPRPEAAFTPTAAGRSHSSEAPSTRSVRTTSR